MSDSSQGPGWWLASDGKWYPPESAPGARQAQQVGGLPSSGPSNGAFQVVQPKVDPLGRPLANYGHRVGATLIDAVLLGVLDFMFGAILNAAMSTSTSLMAGTKFTFSVRGVLVYLVIHGTYTVAMLTIKGQTLGNMALGTRVVDAGTGSPVTLPQAATRYGVQFLLRIPYGLGQLLNYLWPIWDNRWQTLHDKAAKTLVIKG